MAPSGWSAYPIESWAYRGGDGEVMRHVGNLYTLYAILLSDCAMEGVEIYSFGIPWDDLSRCAEMMAGSDVLVPSWYGGHQYDPVVYVREQAEEGSEIVLLTDRNVFTRWVSLLRGCPAEAHDRLAAAVICFSQCSGILIEPNLALYEWADSSSRAAAQEELKLFRQGDNIHPGIWSDVALGRSDRLQARPPVTKEMESEDVDFEMPLRRWRRNYVLTLKLASLALEDGSAEESMRCFMRWSHCEFLIGGPATALAALYLAPNSSRGGLLKRLRSPDRERAIAGIRNAAWDLTYLSDFVKRVAEQRRSQRVHVLCSFDSGVRRLASLIIDYEDPPKDEKGDYVPLFISDWGYEAAVQLAHELARLKKGSEDPSRKIHQAVPAGFVDEMIEAGEERIRRWCAA